MTKNQHWTTLNDDNLLFEIGEQFIEQVDEYLDSNDISRARLAEKLGKTPGRISQVFKNPVRLTLRSVASILHSLRLKATVVIYEDSDEYGPVHPDVFLSCWKQLGQPRTTEDLSNCVLTIHDKSWKKYSEPYSACSDRSYIGLSEPSYHASNDNVELALIGEVVC